MRTVKALFVVAAVAIGFGSAAYAQDAKGEGATIAKKGAGAAVPACVTCHATGAGEFPTLDGQMEFYVINQLFDFKFGKRHNPIMEPIAKALSKTQIESLAKYFSSLPRVRAAQPVGAPELVAKGKALAQGGDPARDLFACDRCHGIDGQGGDFAALSGQNPTYMFAQVTALRAGKRENDSLGMMGAIAQKVTDDEFKAITAYYHQVVPAK